MPSGALTIDRVAEAEGEAQRVGALRLGAVADADDLEFLLEAVGDADDHVVDEAAGEAVQGTVLALVVGTLDAVSVPPSLRTVIVAGDRRG